MCTLRLLLVQGLWPNNRPYLPSEFRRRFIALIRQHRAELAALGVAAEIPPPTGFPAFVHPPFEAGIADLTSQLEQLAAWSREDIQAELGRRYAGMRVPLAYREWAAQPLRARDAYVRALRIFADEVVGALVPAFETRVRRDARQWAAAVAMSDTSTLLAMLEAANPLVRASPGPALRLRASAPSATHRDGEVVELEYGQVLMLCPAVGGPRTTEFSDGYDRGRRDYLAFATPGLRLTGRRAAAPRSDALDHLLGPSRSGILRALMRGPSTTLDLAHALALSPSTVSHHLAFLARGGLVERTRRSTCVHYSVSEVGDRLIEAYLDAGELTARRDA